MDGYCSGCGRQTIVCECIDDDDLESQFDDFSDRPDRCETCGLIDMECECEEAE